MFFLTKFIINQAMPALKDFFNCACQVKTPAAPWFIA